MARNVIVTAALTLVALLPAVSARAMGPLAPFAAPSGGIDEQAQQGAGLVNVQGLSGVRLGRQPGAVIDGVWVPKGQTVRGAKLETVLRSRVILRHPDGHTEALDLFPPTGAGAASTPAPTAVPAPASNEAPPK
jgi:hypothetical protein